MTSKLFWLAALAALWSTSAPAQSCAAPIAISFTGPITGDTCAGSAQLPSLIDGAIQNANQQIVYRMTLASSIDVALALQPGIGADMSMFVCPNQCSTTTTCMAVDANGADGVETINLPHASGDYYVIVQSSNGALPACRTYTLTVQTPLGD
jgi:hypothetical protein